MLLIPSATSPSTARLNWELLAAKYHRISWYWLIETLTSNSLPKSIQSQQLPTTSRERTLFVFRMPQNMGDAMHPAKKTSQGVALVFRIYPPVCSWEESCLWIRRSVELNVDTNHLWSYTQRHVQNDTCCLFNKAAKPFSGCVLWLRVIENLLVCPWVVLLELGGNFLVGLKQCLFLN